MLAHPSKVVFYRPKTPFYRVELILVDINLSLNIDKNAKKSIAHRAREGLRGAFSGVVFYLNYWWWCDFLHIELNQYDIAVLNDIILAFNAHFALFFDLNFAAKGK